MDEPPAKRQRQLPAAAAAAPTPYRPTAMEIDFPANILALTAAGTTQGLTIDLTTTDGHEKQLLFEAARLACYQCGTPLRIDIALPEIRLDVTAVAPQGTFLATFDCKGRSLQWTSAKSTSVDWKNVPGTTVEWDKETLYFLSLSNPAGYAWV